MTRAAERLELYSIGYNMNPRSRKWQGGPGQVVLNAPEEHREEFRKLRSEDIANPIDPGLMAWMGMSPEDQDWERSRNEIHRLLARADQEFARHRKFTLPK